MAEVFGLEVADLPDGAHPLEVILVVKLLAAEGSGRAGVRLSVRVSPGVPLWEAVGMLSCAKADLESQWVRGLDTEG